MQRPLAIALLTLVAALSGGCSALPFSHNMSYSEMQAMMPKAPADKVRIFFYRESAWMGNLITPDIVVNDVRVGVSEPGSFFFIDSNPGDFFVSCGEDSDAQTSFTAAAGDTVYVRTSFAGGVVKAKMAAATVDPPQAIPAIHELKYVALR